MAKHVSNAPKKALALITARGGSKGLPRKNVLEAGGVPLIGWTIKAARACRVIDRLVLSSDDDEIIEAALRLGCEVPFRRPDRLSGDLVSSIDVIEHALEELTGYDYLILLQPTSPLRSAGDIDRAFSLMIKTGAKACVSVTKSPTPPYLMQWMDARGYLQRILPNIPESARRQDQREAYVLNGAIYMAQTKWLLSSRTFLGLDTVGYVMPAERSIDIDTSDDFQRFRQSVES